MTITTVDLGADRLQDLFATISAGALDRERTGEHPFAAIDLIRDARLGALRVPGADGGCGASLRELFATVIALASVDVNVAHILRGHFAHVEERLRLEGEKRTRAIDLALSGKLVGNASTELGTTTVGEFTWKTRLTPHGDELRLNGTKYFTTGTLYADYTEVLASDHTGATVLILVPTDRAGVTVVDDWDGMGQRANGNRHRCVRRRGGVPRGGAVPATGGRRLRPGTDVSVGGLLSAVRDRLDRRCAARIA
jgi:alkylation response protein AidB-like acyl-CoA dehydrogenase